MNITLPRATVEQALEAMRRAVPTGQITLYEWDKAMAALRAALAQQAEPDAYGYASRVAVSIWQWNYKDTAPNWKPLDDLMGVLTQIDNMTSGLTRRAQQAEPVEPVAYRHLHEDGWEYHDAPTGEDCAECQALYTAPPQQAEPVEPVAWCSSVEFSDALKYAQSFNGWRRKYPKTDMPLYTAPPQRKPLPQLAESQCPHPEGHPSLRDAWLDGWEAAERAHGIGGQE